MGLNAQLGHKKDSRNGSLFDTQHWGLYCGVKLVPESSWNCSSSLPLRMGQECRTNFEHSGFVTPYGTFYFNKISSQITKK